MLYIQLHLKEQCSLVFTLVLVDSSKEWLLSSVSIEHCLYDRMCILSPLAAVSGSLSSFGDSSQLPNVDIMLISETLRLVQGPSEWDILWML